MGLRFYFGGSGAGKSVELYQEVIQRSLEEPKTHFLVIVPDQFTMQTQKDMVLQHPNKGIMNIDVLSFGRLSYRVFEEVGGNERPVLDDTGKSLILRKIAGELDGELTVIGSNLKKIGYIHEVKSSISEFMQYGIGMKELDQIIECSKEHSALQYKMKDLKVLYEGFVNYVKDQFITTEESLVMLKKVLHKSALIANSVIVFDGFTGFTPVQNELIKELMVCSKEVIVSITIDSKEDFFQQDGEQKLFHLSKKTIGTLERLAKEVCVARGKDVVLVGNPVKRYEHNPSLAHLEQGLFRFQKNGFEEEQNSIVLYEASSQKEEVRYVLRQIVELIQQKGYKYQDIGVVTGDLNKYAHYIEYEFAKFRIPCFLDQTRGIILNPFIEYIRSGLAVVIQGFTYESVFHFLRSGLVEMEPLKIDQMENYVISMGIRGKRKWEALWTRKTKEMGPDFAQELIELNESRAKVMTLMSHLMEKAETVEEQVKKLYFFITEAKLQQRLVAFEQYFLTRGDMGRAKEYGQIYRLVMELLNQIVELLGKEKMDLREFYQILDAGFGEIQVGTIPQNADQVVVGDIERTRLKKIKVLFFIGINDGIIPKGSGTGGLISDMEREFLSTNQFELAPTPRQQMYIQKLYLYMNMTKPTEQLILSYAKVNGEGKSLRPAYLIGTVLKLYPNLVVIKEKQLSFVEELSTKENGLETLVSMMRSYAEGTLKENSPFFTLYQWYQTHEEQKEFFHQLVKSAFYQYTNHPISKAVATALYGTILENSVSRLERFAGCAYAHFLQYGLQLWEREEFSFENVDMGNIFHGVLEEFGNKLPEKGYTWFDFPEETGKQMVDEAMDSYALEYGDTILFHTARNEYAITRMKRILYRTISTLQYQLQKGKFKPSQFELSFSKMEELPSVQIALSEEEKMLLRGRIDRVDLCQDENDIYVKVIDYKSGAKTFDLVALYYGLQLQLVVYLNAAVELTKKNYPDKNVVPGAVLYYQVTDPMITKENASMTQEELHQKLREELRMKGIVNGAAKVTQMLDSTMTTKSDVIPIEYKKDGSFTSASSVMNQEELAIISNYAEEKIKQFGREILDGEVGINPYEMGNQSSCTYCSYQGICGYDPKLPGFSMRKLDGLEKEEAFLNMKEKK